MRARFGLALTLGVLSVAATDATDASAQRGADFIVQDDVEQGARTGFPGMFDTTTVGRGKMVQSYPWLGVDYGLTENWSVGTNGLALLQNVGLNPAGFLRSRYRVFSGPRFTGVIDGMLFYSRAKLEEDTVTLNSGIVGGNIRYEYSARHAFTGSLHILQLGTTVSTDGEVTDRSTLRLSILALTHELAPNNWYSLRTSLVHAAQLTGFFDQIGATVEINSSGIDGSLQRTGVRVLNSFRVGRWLFSGGGIFVTAVPVPLPWISFSRVYF